MCEELELIQTHLGIWKLEDWDIPICVSQLNSIYGIYCIKNIINQRLLIGEGKLSPRLSQQINTCRRNISWKNDLQKYGKENFRLIWIIEENDEIQRKLIENKLQIHFGEICYNRPRREYPSQKELTKEVSYFKNIDNIVERLNNYTKVQKNYIDECWESNYKLKNNYGQISYLGKNYLHHVLMYIFHHGDICGISSVIHHKCENKKCVNPTHLELVTNKQNMKLYHDTENSKELCQKLFLQGFSTKEISEKTNMKPRRVSGYIDFQTSSKYIGVNLDSKRQIYVAKIQIYKKHINLGNYLTEIEAAQNRDYFLVKNNLLDKPKSTLNFNNIDYNNFNPHTNISGKISKNLMDLNKYV